MRLFEAERHEAWTRAAWDEERARDAVRRIAEEAERAFRPGAYWPLHPLDVSEERPAALKPLYYGAAGILWSLARLAELGAIPGTRDYLPFVDALPRLHAQDLRENPAAAAYLGDRPSFLLGALGMELCQWRLAKGEAPPSGVAETLRRNPGDARGLVWGSAGSMLAAIHLYERTGERVWRDVYVEQFQALWGRLEHVDEAGCRLWTTELYGERATRIGALHGFFGNAYATLRGLELLPETARKEALACIFAAFERTARVEGSLANWPYTTRGLVPAADQPPFVQFCVGAPGVVTCMARFPADAGYPVDDLLAAGGELVWRAGPQAKLPSLCHGAPGSGYAMLKLYERSRDTVWLERARRFAMHAIEQSERALSRHGQHKFSLWTGDLGLALFLASCADADARFPTLDVF